MCVCVYVYLCLNCEDSGYEKDDKEQKKSNNCSVFTLEILLLATYPAVRKSRTT